MKTVAVVGHVCVDLIPALAELPPLAPGLLAEVGALDVRAGGAVANTGIALAEAGVGVRIAANVGSDDLALMLRSALDRAGLDTTGLRATALSTSYSIVIQPLGHDRTFWHHVGTSASFDGSEVDVTGVDLLHLGYPSILPGLLPEWGGPLRDLFSRARDAHVATSLDLAVVDRPSTDTRAWWSRFFDLTLPFVDIVSPSIDDLASALGNPPGGLDEAAAAANDLVGRGAAIAAVSAGAAGIALSTGSAERFAMAGSAVATLGSEWNDRQLSLPAAIIDDPITTTGAGDAATAGFISALLDGRSPEAALESALEFGSATVRGLRPVSI